MAKHFITGIRLRGKTLEWTTLRRGRAEVESSGQTVLEVAGDDLPAPDAPEMIAALRKTCAGLKGEIGLSVPTGQALLRVAEFPSVDAAELQSMVALQIDKISPFPAEHMTVSHEVLTQTESVSRVLIVGVRNDLVDGLGNAFIKAGRVPHWIDLEVLASWQLLADAGRIPAAGRHALLLVDESGSELVVAQDGVPVLFRPLGVSAPLSPEDIGEVVDEIGYTLTTLEAEWGTAEGISMDVWCRGEAPAELIQHIRQDVHMIVEPRDLAELPALTEGLARRFARPGQGINLAVPAWREREQTRHAHRVLLGLTVVFLSIWLGGSAAFLAGLNLQRQQLLKVQAEAEKLTQAADEAKLLEEKVLSLEQYADRSKSALECLREISMRLPAGIDLTSFAYRKGKSVKIRGESPNEGPIYDFIAAMEKSEMFIEAKSGDIARKRRKSGMITEFTVTALLSRDEL